MAAFDTTRTTYGYNGLTGRIGAVFSAIVASVVEWNDARVTRNALSGLSDRELEDIGLNRGDIDHVSQTNKVF
jgi:uncharacterized protein YjiS (DUF1127 family)